MPLHIGRVEADVDVMPSPDVGPQAQSGSPAPSVTWDIEKLRPIVLQILQEELAAFRRQQG